VIVVDGSYGEGGGQILRTSAALSCITGQDIRVINIRVKRKNPGLRPQHITALKAAATLCNAETEGLEIGSKEIFFRPGSVKSGNFKFDIGTAGSVTLVLQTLLPIMAYASGSVKLVLKGGTDVPWSPTIDYLRYVMFYHLRSLGYEVHVTLIRRGHYPKGGGLVEVEVPSPPKGFRPINKVFRGDVLEIKGISHCVRLPTHVARRQAISARDTLRKAGLDIPININEEWYDPASDPHLGPGSGITLWAIAKESVLGSDALGAKGKRAEIVGKEAADKLIADLSTGMALDTHMSDNILIFLSLADGRSVIGGASLTLHALTVMWLLKKFLSVSIEVEGERDKPFKAVISPLRTL
jgi:RNA 3'-terminal phosphate cyclase (ATP)